MYDDFDYYQSVESQSKYLFEGGWEGTGYKISLLSDPISNLLAKLQNPSIIYGQHNLYNPPPTISIDNKPRNSFLWHPQRVAFYNDCIHRVTPVKGTRVVLQFDLFSYPFLKTESEHGGDKSLEEFREEDFFCECTNDSDAMGYFNELRKSPPEDQNNESRNLCIIEQLIQEIHQSQNQKIVNNNICLLLQHRYKCDINPEYLKGSDKLLWEELNKSFPNQISIQPFIIGFQDYKEGLYISIRANRFYLLGNEEEKDENFSIDDEDENKNNNLKRPYSTKSHIPYHTIIYLNGNESSFKQIHESYCEHTGNECLPESEVGLVTGLVIRLRNPKLVDTEDSKQNKIQKLNEISLAPVKGCISGQI
eukprot:gene5055-6292_t